MQSLKDVNAIKKNAQPRSGWWSWVDCHDAHVTFSYFLFFAWMQNALPSWATFFLRRMSKDTILCETPLIQSILYIPPHHQHHPFSFTHRKPVVSVYFYPLRICSPCGVGVGRRGRRKKKERSWINIQWWHKMVLCVPDSFFFVVIKAAEKWPSCLLALRLVFQYPSQMGCVFRG